MIDVESRVVDVVVPTRNDDRLVQCLTALAGQRLPPGWRMDVVVVDNGSHEPPDAVVAGFDGVRMLHEPAGGSYAARNAGVASGDGEVVAFTDSDCRPAPDWLARALAVLEDETVAAVAGDVRLDLSQARPRSLAECWEAVEGFPQAQYVASGFGVTANLVVRREVGRAVGWFDAKALSGGDAAFGRSVTGRGLALVHAPEAVVVHPPRVTVGQVLTKARRTARGQVRLLFGSGQGRWALLAWLVHQVRVLLGCGRRAALDPRLSGSRERGRYLLVAVAFRAVTVVETVRAWPSRPRPGEGAAAR